jgi:pimeloyl-ACP methyl ester carboxylesterase
MAFARNGDVEIYYETFGSPSRPALLLVNGLGSQSINYRTEWCEGFAGAGFFVIRYDNRDVGLSSKFSDVRPDVAGLVRRLAEGHTVDVPYRLSDMAADGLAVLDDLNIEQAHVMGVSMGGMIVQTMAIERPDRLLSLTSVMSTTGDRDVGQARADVAELFYSPPGRDRETVIARAQALEALYASPSEFTLERVAQRVGDGFDRCFSPYGVARQLAAITASGSRTQALRSIDVPALVIHGDADGLIDISGGVRTAQCIPGAGFLPVAGMGHDFPPRYWPTIVEAVSDHARAANAS